MSRQHHYLKCETEYYQAIEEGIKTFEIRINDRDYELYDMIYFREIVNEVETGRETEGYEIKYILYGGKYGLDKDYCIFCWDKND